MAGKDNVKPEQPQEPKKKNTIEEDDEFEDFPAHSWEHVAAAERNLNAWEDVWEDDDEEEDFAVLLALVSCFLLFTGHLN
ncbi:hypothetical protein HK100_003002 [Physocladia obscura]|uniref:26S proteasome complex subunit SEM1 n=1 Tax=Physocladia obscura TaxID=109957 RepID=A0AAD5SXH7_9FUNG|nr:hypothetical protein HK100_003002 [Physocladia obscura]